MELVPKEDLQDNIVPESDLPTGFIQKPVDLKEIANTPEPYKINPNIVGLAGLVGTTVGGVGAKLAKTGGSALVGALEGGLSGLAGSAIGEIVKEATNNSNVGQLTALGGELLSGAALPLARDVITRIPTAGLMAALGYAKAKTAQAVLGESESSRIAKNAIFGKKIVKPGVATTSYTEAFDRSSSLDMANKLNIVIPEGRKAQDVIRQTLYDEMSLKGASGVTIKNSPVYSKLMTDLQQGVKDGIVKPEDIKTISALLNGQASPNTKTLTSFNERLINTAQQATKEFNGIKISDDAADMLKGAIDDYIEKPYYATLKQQEAQRFTAESLDNIPVLLGKGFSGDEVETALRNISRSPQGKQDLQVALASYLRSLPEKEALSEWNRLYSSKVLQRSKVMDLGEILSMNRKVKLYSEKGYIQKAGDITGHALKNSIVTSILPSEGTSRTVNALDIFQQ